MNAQVHPTIAKFNAENKQALMFGETKQIDSEWLHELCMNAGVDDVGFVSTQHPDLAPDRESIEKYAPWAKGLISFVCKMNRDPIRTPARSVANLEFHHIGDRVNEVAHDIVNALEEKGIRALNPSMGFPMEMNNFPDKIWVISHKLVAVAAGLGQMGIHRNVIHPKFGNFILLGTVITDVEFSNYSEQIDYNPCLECKLCVSACPVGAIRPDGQFNFSACYNHNYKEFMGGFTTWVEDIADSRNAIDYRSKVRDNESTSMWQSLSYGANYKAAYCMAVCPAGEDVIGPFLAKRSDFVKQVVKPLQSKPEPIYTVPGSDAEAHVLKRFPHKEIRPIKNGLRPTNINNFLARLSLLFQHDQSAGVNAVYHFTFTGDEQRQATITIKDKNLNIENGHVGKADIKITADANTWIRFLRKETHIAWAILRRKIKIKGNPKLLLKFCKCFLA